MQVTTLITLPEEVYRFYRNHALKLEDLSIEQLMADILVDHATRMTAQTAEESN